MSFLPVSSNSSMSGRFITLNLIFAVVASLSLMFIKSAYAASIAFDNTPDNTYNSLGRLALCRPDSDGRWQAIQSRLQPSPSASAYLSGVFAPINLGLIAREGDVCFSLWSGGGDKPLAMVDPSILHMSGRRSKISEWAFWGTSPVEQGKKYWIV